jgi:hypothetical protein
MSLPIMLINSSREPLKMSRATRAALIKNSSDKPKILFFFVIHRPNFQFLSLAPSSHPDSGEQYFMTYWDMTCLLRYEMTLQLRAKHDLSSAPEKGEDPGVN